LTVVVMPLMLLICGIAKMIFCNFAIMQFRSERS